MTSGKTIRLNRLMKNGRTIIAAMDHTRFMGPVGGARSKADVTGFVSQANAMGIRGMIVTPLILQVAAEHTGQMVNFVSVAGGTSPQTIPQARTDVCTSVERALQLGADGIYYWAVTHYERDLEHLRTIGKLTEKCAEYGLPFIAEAMTRNLFQYSVGKISAHDAINADDLCASCRLVAELGADIVKTHYPGNVDALKRIVESCLVPVIIAGGPATRNDDELLQLIHDCVEAGAAGFALGRSFFQHPEPEKIMKQVRETVFG